MQTAATPLDANATLDIEWTVESPTTQCYPYLYFPELQTLQANDTREFNLMLNGAFLYGPILPTLDMEIVYDKLPNQCTDGKCVLQLTKTPRSTLPPILSAYEVYTVMDFPQLETNDDDGNPHIISKTGPCVSKEDIVVPVSIAVVVTSLALLVTALVIFFLCRQKRSLKGPPSSNGPSPASSNGPSPASSELTVTTRITRFTYSQVTTMTKNFQRVIGEGGFGSVYLGFVNGAEQVAVKVLSHSSSQGDREFRAEVQLLLRVHHKNLVGLVG
ncbi:unnamed protein product, partial [Arabidopsis halleri]